MNLSMFTITQGKGFHMTFSNGCTISVQFGSGNYCSNRDTNFNPSVDHFCESPDAEIAVWDQGHNFITREFFPDLNDDVIDHLSTNHVLDLMIEVATRSKP